MIDIYTEDRTGGGLQNLLVAAARLARSAAGKPPLRTPRSGVWGSAKNNSKLVEFCGRYDSFRFERRPALEHVFFVIDLKEGERLVRLPSIRPGDLQGRARVVDALLAAMTSRARGDRDDEQWARVSDGFHPFVLEWERESLILPVTDALELGPPPRDPSGISSAAAWLADRYREVTRKKYEKGIDGMRLLGRIAERPDLIERVLENASVRRIVERLVAL